MEVRGGSQAAREVLVARSLRPGMVVIFLVAIIKYLIPKATEGREGRREGFFTLKVPSNMAGRHISSQEAEGEEAGWSSACFPL